jgi:putative ABC transport system substrate-binding protein
LAVSGSSSVSGRGTARARGETDFLRYFATDGGLISYGPDEMDLFRRTAGYVHQILKGARTSDLPVQQPTKFELIINLTTAKALGLTIPPGVLSIADDLVE